MKGDLGFSMRRRVEKNENVAESFTNPRHCRGRVHPVDVPYPGRLR